MDGVSEGLRCSVIVGGGVFGGSDGGGSIMDSDPGEAKGLINEVAYRSVSGERLNMDPESSSVPALLV